MSQFALANVRERIGSELGVSGWLLVDQARIDRFAECTGDRQWIHVDVERAKRESPFRTPIAHGYPNDSIEMENKMSQETQSS